MTYDYREAMEQDIREWITENFEFIEDNVHEPYENRDEVEEFLYDTLWTEDSVTGNASGSYTFNRAQAGEYVRDNLALAIEAMNEFGYGMDKLAEKVEEEDWEYLDVTIRCYLLGEMIAKVVEEINAERG